MRYIFLETILSTYFKTVNHNILLKKMEFVQFSEETKKWLKSYLPNGKFKVHIKNTFSEPGNLLQGSILGPLLFLLYINDMPRAVDHKLLPYADDTCLIFQHKDINEIETALNKNFHFNDDKTKSILFSSKHEIKNLKPLNIQYSDIIKQYSKVT